MKINFCHDPSTTFISNNFLNNSFYLPELKNQNLDKLIRQDLVHYYANAKTNSQFTFDFRTTQTSDLKKKLYFFNNQIFSDKKFSQIIPLSKLGKKPNFSDSQLIISANQTILPNNLLINFLLLQGIHLTEANPPIKKGTHIESLKLSLFHWIDFYKI